MEVSPTYELYESDVDLLNLSNLMWKKEDRTLRNVYFPPPKNIKKKMKPFIVSDSFFHAISWTGLFPQIFQPNTPYYYYFQSRVEPNGSSNPINYAVLENDLKQSDCILIITDIQNLTQFGFGFIEQYIQQKRGF